MALFYIFANLALLGLVEDSWILISAFSKLCGVKYMKKALSQVHNWRRERDFSSFQGMGRLFFDVTPERDSYFLKFSCNV